MFRTIIVSQEPFLTPEDKKRTAPLVRDAISRIDEQINKLLEYLRVYPLNRQDRPIPAEPDFAVKLPRDGDEDVEKIKTKPNSGLSLPWSKQPKSFGNTSRDQPLTRQYTRTLRKFLRYLEEPEY